MVKALIGLLLLLCCLGPPARSVPLFDSTGTSAAAQDATGAVWAVRVGNGNSYTSNDTGTLLRWQAGAWTTQTIPGTAGFYACTVTRGGDGSVYALWQTLDGGSPQTPDCLLTIHRGPASRIFARFPGPVVRNFGFPSAPSLSAGNDGDVWLAGYQPLIRHFSADGSSQTFPLKPEQFFGGKLPDDYHSFQMSSLVDGAGRRWLWQDRPRDFWPWGTLRGVLIWNGKTLDYHPTLPGIPDESFTAVTALDANHFWLAAGDNFFHAPMARGALYRVDTRTLTATPETPPQPDAFGNVLQVFPADGGWYAVTQERYGAGTTALWRKRVGQWRKCVDNLEGIGGYYQMDGRHPWLSEPTGVWLGVSGGAWWLPRADKPPVWVDWRRGLAALQISGLFPLPDGGILAAGWLGAARMPPTPQPVRPLPPGVVSGGMGAPKYLGPLVADPRNHLWGTPRVYTGPCLLDEWDGRRWQTHLSPKSIPGVNGLYACDTLGRFWLTTSNWHPPAQPQPVYGRAVYDPAHDTWTKYDTVPDALVAAAALPGMAFLPFHNAYGLPSFSGDGRVVYVDDYTLFLYDGKIWHHWKAHDIQPSDTYSNLSPQPRFNSDGHLETALDDRRWEWTPAEGWQRTGAQETAQYENPVPPGGPRGMWSGTPAVDSGGAKWFTWHGAVYRAWHGRWAKPSELSAFGSPFQDGRAVDDVLRDPVGRFFFVTRPAGYYDLVVWSPPPTPGVTLSVTPTAEDSVAVRVRAKPPGAGRFLWRLNGGDWKTAQTADTIRLTALPHGDYRVEAEALDPNLQTSAPSVAVFSIRVTPQRQIARWVRALLSGTEDAREAAVAGLVKQPDAALPALRAARPGASEAGRWWLDAAIQQITGRDGGDEGN